MPLPRAGHRDGFPRGRIHTLKAIAAGELGDERHGGGAFRQLPGLLCLRERLPLRRALRPADRSHRPCLNQPELRTPWQTSFRKLLLAVLPYPRRLRALLTPLRAYAGTPLQNLARSSGALKLLGPQLQAMEALLRRWRRKVSPIASPP